MKVVGERTSEARREHSRGIMASANAREGDIVVLLLGSKLIYVLRPTKMQKLFTLVCAGRFWLTTTDRGLCILDNKKRERIDLGVMFYGDLKTFDEALGNSTRRRLSLKKRCVIWQRTSFLLGCSEIHRR
jgi:ligand-binding sensor domain-containing protein